MTRIDGFMELPFTSYFIVFPLVFFAGLVDAVAGGGGLIALPAYIIAGVPAHFALGTNKLSSSIGTLFSTGRFVQKKHFHFSTAVVAVLFSFLGSFIGTQLVLQISADSILYILIIILPALIFVIVKSRDIGKMHTYHKYSTFALHSLAGIISFVIGMYDGFFGPGAGTFLILGFTLIIGFEMRTAAGNAKLVNLASNIAAFIGFYRADKVHLKLGLIAAIFSIAGHLVGAEMAIKKGVKIIKPVFYFVLAVLMSKICYDLFMK